MAYSRDDHERLDVLTRKYGSWFMSDVRSAYVDGRPIFSADGVESTLSGCYEDAIVTFHALYMYLVENPCHELGSSGRESLDNPLRPDDMIDDVADVNAGQNEQGHGVDHLRVRSAGTTEVAAEDGPGSERVDASTSDRLELLEGLPQGQAPLSDAGDRSVERDLEPAFQAAAAWYESHTKTHARFRRRFGTRRPVKHRP